MSGRLEQIEQEANRARQWVRENLGPSIEQHAHAKIPVRDVLLLVEIARCAQEYRRAQNEGDSSWAWEPSCVDAHALDSALARLDATTTETGT